MKNEIITFTITMIFIIIIIGDAADRPDDGDDISGEINNKGIESHCPGWKTGSYVGKQWVFGMQDEKGL